MELKFHLNFFKELEFHEFEFQEFFLFFIFQFAITWLSKN